MSTEYYEKEDGGWPLTILKMQLFLYDLSDEKQFIDEARWSSAVGFGYPIRVDLVNERCEVLDIKALCEELEKNMKSYQPIEKEVFHVHTYRCKHADNIRDVEYVERAIELGAKRIVFTDHAPFQENPFGNRMDIEKMEDYVEELCSLKEQYKQRIEILIGLEVEYLPSYLEYYKSLRDSQKFDVLILGQHFYEYAPGKYSFSISTEEIVEKEFVGCGHAIVEGINTGIFDVVAHPDRIFRRRKEWTTEMESVAKQIIDAARMQEVYLEKNKASMKKKNQYWEEFWGLVPEQMIVKGLDAHSIKELEVW